MFGLWVTKENGMMESGVLDGDFRMMNFENGLFGTEGLRINYLGMEIDGGDMEMGFDGGYYF